MNDREDGRLWYSHGPENHTTMHFTTDEAEKAAQDEMQYYRDCAADDLWHEDIDALSWGEMIPHGKAQCVERQPSPEGAPYDEYEDWQLVRLPVAEPAHDPLTCPCCRFGERLMAGKEDAISILIDRLAQAEKRASALEASLAECARWLLDYGQHTPRCPVPHAAWHSTGETCTCGLDDLVQRAEALLKETK